jgi:hypothetical protein
VRGVGKKKVTAAGSQGEFWGRLTYFWLELRMVSRMVALLGSYPRSSSNLPICSGDGSWPFSSLGRRLTIR